MLIREINFYEMKDMQEIYNILIKTYSVCSDNEKARAKNLHIKPRLDTKAEMDKWAKELEDKDYYLYYPVMPQLQGKCECKIYIDEEDKIMFVVYIETDEKQAKEYYVNAGEISEIQVYVPFEELKKIHNELELKKEKE